MGAAANLIVAAALAWGALAAGVMLWLMSAPDRPTGLSRWEQDRMLAEQRDRAWLEREQAIRDLINKPGPYLWRQPPATNRKDMR